MKLESWFPGLPVRVEEAAAAGSTHGDTGASRVTLLACASLAYAPTPHPNHFGLVSTTMRPPSLSQANAAPKETVPQVAPANFSGWVRCP